MTIRQLIQIAVSTGNLDADVKISNYDDITSIRFDSDPILRRTANILRYDRRRDKEDNEKI